MLRFIVCEDNKDFLSRLCTIVNKEMMPYNFEYKISKFTEYSNELKAIINKKYEQKIYVGQTKKCLKERVLQHFTKPQSQFDKTHSLEEVSNIYVLNVSEEYLDYVEMDCIASIPSKLLFNVFAGGGSIEMITTNTYDPKRYLLDDNFISFISEQANIINSIKKKQEKNDKCSLLHAFRHHALPFSEKKYP